MVDPTSVVGTHLSQVIRRHAPTLLGRQETQKLLDLLGIPHDLDTRWEDRVE